MLSSANEIYLGEKKVKITKFLKNFVFQPYDVKNIKPAAGNFESFLKTGTTFAVLSTEGKRRMKLQFRDLIKVRPVFIKTKKYLNLTTK